MLLNDNYKTFCDNFLAPLSLYLKELSNKKILISPYFSNSDTSSFRQMYEYFFKNSYITHIAPQDGAGCNRTFYNDQIPLYFSIYKKLTNIYNITLWANMEVFNQIHGWPVDDQAWEAVPTDIDSILIGLDTLSNYSDTIVAFEYWYMDPNRGEKETKLYNDYLSYFSNIQNSTSINFTEKVVNRKIKVYPNPFNNILNIINFDFNSPIKIYNINGKEILSIVPPNSYINIDFSNFPTGIYFIRSNNEILKVIYLK